MKARPPDTELRLILLVTHRLPRIRGAGILADWLERFYVRKPRGKVMAKLEGYSVDLDPVEGVEKDLLFCPQLYDFREIAFVRANLTPGDVFIDVGAHVGFYSLVASRCVGPTGRVLAVEADGYNHRRLVSTVEDNGIENLTPILQGVSDCRQVLPFRVHLSGNRVSNTFLEDDDGDVEVVQVECSPLLEILEKEGVDSLKGCKIDVEGFDYRVLKKFFDEAPESLYPRFVIVEHIEKFFSRTGGNTIELLQEHGYVVRRKTKRNYLMKRAGVA